MGSLSSIFDPKSVALIGASDVEGSAGRIVLTNLLSSKGSRVFPVNRRKNRLLEKQCYPDIGSVPGHVDLAVIAVPAADVPLVVEECGKAGVGGAVIVSAGFGESGPEGLLLERQVGEIRKRYGMRILGPNSLGFARPRAGINALMLQTPAPSGDIAFISQSGAMGDAILDWAGEAHVGFSMFVGLGTMMDVGFGDLIDFLGEDMDTRSILMYMEKVGDAKKFISAARAFALRKPIVILKLGRHARKDEIPQSRTAAMAAEDEVYDAAFKRAGVIRVREIADLFDAAAVLHSERLPAGPRLAIVTPAAGPGIMAVDSLLDFGGTPARLTAKTVEELNGLLPPAWGGGNPVKVLGDASVQRYKGAIDACIRDPEVDGVLVIYAPMITAKPEDVARAVIESAKKTVKPVLAAWMGATQVREARQMLVQNDIPSYGTPEQGVRTYVHMYRYRRNLGLLYETPFELPEREPLERAWLKATIENATREGRTLLNERESKDFLASYGIPTTLPSITATMEEAVALAREKGYPVVIKVVSPHISLKSDVGGVITGINSDDHLREAWTKMMEEVREKAPQATIRGIAIEKMIEPVDYELIIGSKRNRDFGSFILFGMGGLTAELIGDFSVALPPLNQTLAKRLMEDTKAYRLIQGYRGKPPADLLEIEKVLVNFSNLIVYFPEIREIDVNPLAISNGKPFALDARIIIEGQPADSSVQYPHLAITPYPSSVIRTIGLRDGTEVLIRPMKPEDEPLERELFETLSQDSIRKRLFSPFGAVTHEKLIVFCNIDYDRQLAIVAEISEKGRRRIIGVARLYADSDTNTGEFALIIHDSFQGKGLGRRFMEILIERAKKKGLAEIKGEILAENEKMISLARKMGFTRSWIDGGVALVRLPLNTPSSAK